MPRPCGVRRASSFSSSRLLTYVALAVSLVGLSACGDNQGPGPSFVRRDSAGITIAENRGAPPEDGGGWAISSEPSLQIGAMDGDEAYILFRVRGAARLSDGRIALVNNQAPDVRIFGPNGEHLHTFGQRGEGPEDFDSPSLVGVLPGDTLVVVDMFLRRVNLYHPDQGFVRGSTADQEIEGFLFSAGMFSSGSVLTTHTVWQEEMPNGLVRFPELYRSVTPDGTLEREFGEFTGNETVFHTQEIEGGVGVLSSGRPFGKGSTRAVAGDRFFYSSQDAYEFKVYHQDGDLVQIIRRDLLPIPVTDGHVDSVMEEMVDQADDNDEARQFRQMFREAPIPDLHPAHGFIYADVLGWLWVEEYRLPGEEIRHTTIFDPEGKMVGSVILPDRFRVFEIGEDYILGRTSDELGVEYLRMYELTRPG